MRGGAAIVDRLSLSHSWKQLQECRLYTPELWERGSNRCGRNDMYLWRNKVSLDLINQ